MAAAASSSGVRAMCSGRRAKCWLKPEANTPKSSLPISIWRAANRCAVSGRSCAIVGLMPMAIYCDATVIESNPETPVTSADQALLDQPIKIVERDGVRYTLLGTAHISQASVNAVRALIASQRFDTVAVELDANRHRALTGADALVELDLFAIVRSGQAGLVAANLAQI